MTSEAGSQKAPAEPSAASAKAQPASRPVDFVKKVGKGRTLSADLASGEARTAFNLLLDGAFHPAQAGAFLQALRIKELSQEELDALAETFRSRMAALRPLAGEKSLVLNMASDTQRKGGLASLLAAHLLRRFGIGVGIVRSAPVLQKNKASFEETWELAKLLDPAGPLFPMASGPAPAPAPVLADCAALVPGLASLDDLRSQLGFRSCLHTAEKLVNPWPASPMLLGISHKHYALRLAATMAAQGARGRILLGNHGTVDLVLHKETEMVAVETGAAIREETVSPAELGLEIPSDVYSLGKFPQWREWLLAMAVSAPPEGRDNGLRKAVQYHLAVHLWAAGAAENAAEGLASAKRAIPTLFV
ncbi:MAG: anthranilate phosphoribosyltransferase [Fibrobacteres bacterium]|nr:anthranilate phosphoribosyltransferase [Fibrobacterota bacterium]